MKDSVGITGRILWVHVEWFNDEYGASGFGGDGSERGDLCSTVGAAPRGRV